MLNKSRTFPLGQIHVLVLQAQALKVGFHVHPVLHPQAVEVFFTPLPPVIFLQSTHPVPAVEGTEVELQMQDILATSHIMLGRHAQDTGPSDLPVEKKVGPLQS